MKKIVIGVIVLFILFLLLIIKNCSCEKKNENNDNTENNIITKTKINEESLILNSKKWRTYILKCGSGEIYTTEDQFSYMVRWKTETNPHNWIHGNWNNNNSDFYYVRNITVMEFKLPPNTVERKITIYQKNINY